jgi:hypothetical protein
MRDLDRHRLYAFHVLKKGAKNLAKSKCHINKVNCSKLCDETSTVDVDMDTSFLLQ